jgi:hypothetical protein
MDRKASSAEHALKSDTLPNGLVLETRIKTKRLERKLEPLMLQIEFRGEFQSALNGNLAALARSETISFE